ncbi:MAG TPA: type II secretion system protein GspM [Gallionella sp.]|nr:type II secretion system protein GspM [Gallionella sp.]
MKQYWQLVRNKIDGMSLRERTVIFLAVAFIVVALVNIVLLDPLLVRQKAISSRVVQQQEKIKELQAQMEGLLQAKRDDEHSPLRTRLAQLRRQLLEQDGYLQSRRDRLIEPDKMAGLLEQVLNKNDKLQLVELRTIPASTLVEKQLSSASGLPAGQKQIFKHGMQITVRGGYLDMLRYLAALEKMPVQMLWGEISLSVDKYPHAVLTLTLYTLSLDKTWLAV